MSRRITGPVKTTFSQCIFCSRKRSGSTCEAFPLGPIPDQILENEHSHKEPFPGDNGILFDGKKGIVVPRTFATI
jgi:hypothetical protein